MKHIRISPDLALPIDVVTQTMALVAKRRAGKSSTAKRIVEQLFHARQQVVVLDPKGDWWGLRSSADGKSEGLPILIVGGEHGDLKLDPASGEAIARMVVEERLSVIIDLSELRKSEVARFCADFLETFYRLKAKEEFRTAVLLVVDEADAIAPQRPQHGEERMLGAIEDVVRRGGQRGIGCLMASQRAAVLNKNVLTQVQILVVLRTIAPQDIKAMLEWIEVHGTAKQRETLMASLASLPTGTAWFWSPGWPTEEGIFKRVQVDRCETFDSGATPKAGETRLEPKTLADVDLAAVQKRMAATIERAKADDPRELRKKIHELEKQLKARVPAPKPEPTQPWKGPRVKYEPAITDGQITRLEKAVARLAEIPDLYKTTIGIEADKLQYAFEPIRSGLAKFNNGAAARGKDGGTTPVMQRAVIRKPAPAPATPSPAAADADAKGVTPAQLRILKALAEFADIGRYAVSRTWVAARAGASHRSSSYANNLGALRSAGLIRYQGGEIALEPAGRELVPKRAELLTNEAMLASCLALLTPKQAGILRAAYDAYPNSVARHDVAATTQQSNASSSFANNLGALRSAGMIEYVDGGITAADWLFVEGA